MDKVFDFFRTKNANNQSWCIYARVFFDLKHL